MYILYMAGWVWKYAAAEEVINLYDVQKRLQQCDRGNIEKFRNLLDSGVLWVIFQHGFFIWRCSRNEPVDGCKWVKLAKRTVINTEKFYKRKMKFNWEVDGTVCMDCPFNQHKLINESPV